MRDGLNATNRSIFFSLCGWETWYAPEGKTLANSWRIGPDDGNWQNIVKNIDLMAQVAQYAGPDKGWNDPCLLVSADWMGKKLITELQTRAQFSMWSVMTVGVLFCSHTGI
jgi:alpha-galactosidase